MIIVRRTLRSRRRSLIWWAIGLFAITAIIVLAYPSVRDTASFQDIVEDYPEFVQEILGLGGGLAITEAGGYLNSQFYTSILPITLLIFLVAFGVRETAGDEKEGVLDLLLAHPVTRTRFVLEKMGSMVAGGAVLTAVTVLTLVAVGPVVDLGLGVSSHIGVCVSLLLLGLVFGMTGLAIGAVTGNRAVAMGAVSGAAIGSYLLWGLAAVIDGVSGLERLSPFFWAFAGDPVVDGLQVGNALVLTGISVVAAVVAVWGFGRRDIRV